MQEYSASGASAKFRVTSERVSTTNGTWAYRCDDCAWTCVAKTDPVECQSCGGDTNRAPDAIARALMAVA